MSLEVAKGKIIAYSDRLDEYAVHLDILEGDALQYGKYYVHHMGEGYYFDDVGPAVQAFVALHEFAIKEYAGVI